MVLLGYMKKKSKSNVMKLYLNARDTKTKSIVDEIEEEFESDKKEKPTAMIQKIIGNDVKSNK